MNFVKNMQNFVKQIKIPYDKLYLCGVSMVFINGMWSHSKNNLIKFRKKDFVSKNDLIQNDFEAVCYNVEPIFVEIIPYSVLVFNQKKTKKKEE